MHAHREKQREEYAIILDYLPEGYPFSRTPSYRRQPIAQAVGTTFFTPLELVPRADVQLKVHEKVYIGSGERDKIEKVKGVLPVKRMTATARNELEHVLRMLIHEQEERFVRFFNEAGPLSLRMHSLELLPGVGKKLMREIIEAREEKPFESFEDMRERLKIHPEELILRRILEEYERKDRYKLFTK